MKILVGTDFSKNSENALHYAADLAAYCKGELLIVHVFQSMKPTGKMGLNQKIRDDWETEMQLLLSELKKSHPALSKVKSSIIKGEANKKLEVLYDREKVDLLIIGAKGESDDEQDFLGNVAGKMIKLSDMPMMVIPQNAKFEPINAIVFAIKRTQVSKKKTLAPLKLVQGLFDSRLTILQVSNDIKKLKIGNHLSRLANNLVTIESDSFYKPIEEFVTYGDFNMLCVVRRARGFFHKFLITKSFPKNRFNINLPMLVLQGRKSNK